jgi:hypothetical protein
VIAENRVGSGRRRDAPCMRDSMMRNAARKLLREVILRLQASRPKEVISLAENRVGVGLGRSSRTP